MARLARTPSTAEAYPPEYYGSVTKKFLPGFESLSHVPPALLTAAEEAAKKIAAKEGRIPCVLDIGCGRGYLLRRLKRAGWTCAGIDIPESPLPTEEAGLDCRHGDATKLPWDNSSFDLVVINHVLEHVSDPLLACKEAARVLRDGGVLYIGVPNFGSWQSRFFGRNWFPLEIPRHIYHFTPEALAAVVSSAGFMSAQSVSTWSLPQGVFGFIQSALNWIAPKSRNTFLSLVKGRWTEAGLTPLVHLAGACVLLPAGLLETIASSFAKKGPVIAMLAHRKRRHSIPPPYVNNE
jgi:SAM-dependent methyltransferase